MVVCRCRQACERASVCVSTRVHVCVPSSLHHSPGSPPKLPTRPFSKPAARQSLPPPPAACASPLSISVCLTRETATSGDPVPGPLTPARCAVLLAWGFSLAPSKIYCFPRGLGAKALREVPSGAPQGQPGSTPTRPPRRACVGVEVMAPVDIVTSVSVT